jgi:hypothetical protein
MLMAFNFVFDTNSCSQYVVATAQLNWNGSA